MAASHNDNKDVNYKIDTDADLDKKEIDSKTDNFIELPKTLYSIVEKYKDLKDYKIIVSKRSQELKARDKKNEYRYVINVYILEESKTLLACYTPTYTLPLKNAHENNKAFSAAQLLAMKIKFNNEVAEVDQEIPGVAHTNGEKIQRKYDPELKNIPENTLRLGLSVKNQVYVGRSTMNWKIFILNPLWRMMTYFNDEKNFIINSSQLSYNLARSLPTWFMDKFLNEAHFPVFQSYGTIDSLNQELEEDLKDVENLFISISLQKTMYIAAGMICSKENQMIYQIPPSHIILQQLFEVSDKHHIPLNLNWIPGYLDDFDTQSSNGATAVMHAAKQGHLDSMKLLLQKRADYTLLDVNSSNILHYALESKNKKILNELLLLPKIEELLLKKNKSNVTPLDIIKIQYPDLYKSLSKKWSDKISEKNAKEIDSQSLKAFLLSIDKELNNTIKDDKNNTLFEISQLKLFLGQFNHLIKISQKNSQLPDISALKNMIDDRKLVLEMVNNNKQTELYAASPSSALLLMTKLSREITPYLQLQKLTNRSR